MLEETADFRKVQGRVGSILKSGTVSLVALEQAFSETCLRAALMPCYT